MSEPDTFDEFVRTCSHRLHRLGCLLTGGDVAGAEDLAAEALARVYLAWSRIRYDDAYSYAGRTMVNINIDWRRRLRVRREIVTDEVHDVADGCDRNDQLVQRDSIMSALRRLTRRERTVIVLRYYLDFSEQRIADELRISPGTVKSTSARALAKLRISPDLTEPTQSTLPMQPGRLVHRSEPS